MPRDYRIAVQCQSSSGHRAFFRIDTGDGEDREEPERIPGRGRAKTYATPVRATAERRAWVRIRVVDHDGQPVEGGGVMAVDAERHYGGSAPIGEDGVAVLIVNQPGVHDVIYASDPLRPTVGLMQSVDIQKGEGQTVEFRLPAARIVTGKVVDAATGIGVPGVYVYGGSRTQAEEGTPQPKSAMVVTRAGGRFEVPVVEGVVTLSIGQQVDGYFVPVHYSPDRDPGPEPDVPKVEVTANGAPEEVVIRIAKGLTIEGSVEDAEGRPVKGAKVAAANEDRPYRSSATVTDAEGRFRFEGFSPYVPTRVSASSDAGYAEQTIEATADHPWEESLTKSVELKLASGTSVAGRVVRDGRPLEGVVVRLLRMPPAAPGEQRVPIKTIGETKTDAEGKYRLTGLRKGERFEVKFEPLADADLRSGPLHRGIRTVGVEDGATIELPDAVFKSAGQSLSGVVVDLAGKPLAGISVSAMLPSGEILSRPQNGPAPWTDTDEQGRFTLTNLPDEPIELMAHKRNPGERILRPARFRPAMNANDIRIILDPDLATEPESLD